MYYVYSLFGIYSKELLRRTCLQLNMSIVPHNRMPLQLKLIQANLQVI